MTPLTSVDIPVNFLLISCCWVVTHSSSVGCCCTNWKWKGGIRTLNTMWNCKPLNTWGRRTQRSCRCCRSFIILGLPLTWQLNNNNIVLNGAPESSPLQFVLGTYTHMSLVVFWRSMLKMVFVSCVFFLQLLGWPLLNNYIWIPPSNHINQTINLFKI